MGFCGVKSRTLGLFTPCHSISKPIVLLRGKKSQGKVSRGKESQGKVSRGKKSHHPNYISLLIIAAQFVKIPIENMLYFKKEVEYVEDGLISDIKIFTLLNFVFQAIKCFSGNHLILC